MFKGFLIDLDGVIYRGSELIPGAADAVSWLRGRGYPFRFLTNTSRKSRASVVTMLQDLGLSLSPEEVVTTTVVASRWLRASGTRRVQLLLSEDAQRDFSDFELTDADAEAVLMGDMGPNTRFDVLNRAFVSLKNGARLVALQKNRYWRSEEGLALDAGAFVTALEYAAEVKATLIGKPSKAFFEKALEPLPLEPSEVAMVGDDPENDIAGAKACGLGTILVRTGKYEGEAMDSPPDWLLASIGDLPARLGH